MKTAHSNENIKFIYSSKPEMLDDFWNDCIDQKEKKQNIKNNCNNNINHNQKLKTKKNNNNFYQNTHYIPSEGRKPVTRKSNIQTYKSDKLFKQKKMPNKKFNSSKDKYLSIICDRHPSYVEELRVQEYKKMKSKKALIRCYGLYAYGLELQKTMEMNKEKNEKHKLKNAMSQCTFKPKLNKKISYLDDKIYCNRDINRLYQNNPKKILNKSVDNLYKNDKKYINKNRKNDAFTKDDDMDECTFKPKFESDPKTMEKMFKKRKNRSKEFDEFLLRYTKARDEHLIKRFKKLYRKDDSYDNSLLTITNRVCNKQYRNYLNVNNTILLFGQSINSGDYLHSSIGDFRGLTISNEIPEKKESKNSFIMGLRKNLHSFDFNENE